jgi:citrate lyase subunit alpha / citrate CoA-transferase
VIKNSLNRNLPDSYKAFTLDNAFLSMPYTQLKKSPRLEKTTIVDSLETLFDLLKITDGMTLSFHHHYRNGDLLLNMVAREIVKRNIKNIVLAPSAIFPIHEPLVELIKHKNVTKIYTNYVNGPVADAISHGFLDDLLIMDTHGGRARAIETGDISIDVAFIAASAADPLGNANGIDGIHPCGPLGYIYPDLYYAKKTVVVTDTIFDVLSNNDIPQSQVDYLIKVDCIGLSSGIESGTTSMTKDPIQLKIAKDCVNLMEELNVIKNHMSFQTGAGSTSIAVSHFLKQKMQEKKIKGSFASGGITATIVDMHQNELFEKLYDVQSFDMTAVNSYKNNKNHLLMDASLYANPFHKNNIAKQLDVVILGATEIDLDFNVNVTTSSTHKLMGGSGGHSDTAYESKLTIITTNLVKSRNATIRKHIQTISTPGSSVDILVTERGIAINPLRKDLIENLKVSKLNILTIEQLYHLAIKITGIPETYTPKNNIIGLIRYRDGSYIDSIYEV